MQNFETNRGKKCKQKLNYAQRAGTKIIYHYFIKENSKKKYIDL